jgi:hypothetical protein
MFPARKVVTSLKQRLYNHDKHPYVNKWQCQAECIEARYGITVTKGTRRLKAVR